MAKPFAVFTFVFAAYAFTSQQPECKSDPQIDNPRIARRRSVKGSGSTGSGQIDKFEKTEKGKSKKDRDCQMTPPDPPQPKS
jgi:hypothetical protein